jgi:hypothetical protein
MANRFFVPVVAVGLLAVAGASVSSQDPRAQRPAFPEGFPDLAKGLRETKGCLGVETAETGSGKRVIFAWFADKKACLEWYYSDAHRGAMHAFFKDPPTHEPLGKIPDDVGPIMAVASITLGERPGFEASSLPISQISIELYKPITGGIFLGGRFAPESLKVPDMLDLSKKGG